MKSLETAMITNPLRINNQSYCFQVEVSTT